MSALKMTLQKNSPAKNRRGGKEDEIDLSDSRLATMFHWDKQPPCLLPTRKAERRVASDLEAAEKRIIALREDAAVVKPEWVGNLVFSR
eukprot:gene34622-44757_t